MLDVGCNDLKRHGLVVVVITYTKVAMWVLLQAVAVLCSHLPAPLLLLYSRFTTLIRPCFLLMFYAPAYKRQHGIRNTMTASTIGRFNLSLVIIFALHFFATVAAVPLTSNGGTSLLQRRNTHTQDPIQIWVRSSLFELLNMSY